MSSPAAARAAQPSMRQLLHPAAPAAPSFASMDPAAQAKEIADSNAAFAEAMDEEESGGAADMRGGSHVAAAQPGAATPALVTLPAGQATHAAPNRDPATAAFAAQMALPRRYTSASDASVPPMARAQGRRVAAPSPAREKRGRMRFIGTRQPDGSTRVRWYDEYGRSCSPTPTTSVNYASAKAFLAERAALEQRAAVDTAVAAALADANAKIRALEATARYLSAQPSPDEPGVLEEMERLRVNYALKKSAADRQKRVVTLNTLRGTEAAQAAEYEALRQRLTKTRTGVFCLSNKVKHDATLTARANLAQIRKTAADDQKMLLADAEQLRKQEDNAEAIRQKALDRAAPWDSCALLTSSGLFSPTRPLLLSPASSAASFSSASSSPAAASASAASRRLLDSPQLVDDEAEEATGETTSPSGSSEGSGDDLD